MNSLVSEISNYDSVLYCFRLTQDGICKDSYKNQIPEHAHIETITTMLATVYGAATYAAEELNKKISHLQIVSEDHDILLFNLRNNDLLAIGVKKNTDLEKLISLIPAQ